MEAVTAPRQAACDPCRKAKLSCDHKQPVCRRCLKSNRAAVCVYRASPFKRRRLDSSLVHEDPSTRTPISADASPATPSARYNPYPNPGHLGSSSHAAIFNQIVQGSTNFSAADAAIGPIPSATQYSQTHSAEVVAAANRAAEMLKELLNDSDLIHMKDLVDFWLAKGISLALAEPVVKQCAQTVDHVQSTMRRNDVNWHLNLSMRLLQNSERPLEYDGQTRLSSFVEQFCGYNARWETFGIFLSAVTRATFDVSFFPSLYTTETKRNRLRRLATTLSSCALELCLSLDALNDLQLIFQYEHFIVQSNVHGDQSFHSWRSLGDVIASLFALGYHENIQLKPDTPPFLIEIRKTAFARVYSADKNIAIFLGRPPRMSKRFSYFQVPSNQVNWEPDRRSVESRSGPQDWSADAEVSYRAETRWSALCASIKEEILELLFCEDRSNHAPKARSLLKPLTFMFTAANRMQSEIASRAEAQWQALPSHFRLSGNLKQCTRSAIECDFLVSTRLNHLHVQFLLRLVLLDCLAEPDESILEVSRLILALVVEALLFREHLANSGTTLIWKIAHYGLPAAGIILLAMLKFHETANAMKTSRFRIWQDLNILVAEIQMGSIVRPGEPNYALLSKATETIQSFLINYNDGASGPQVSTEQREVPGLDDWFPRLNPDPWNLEIEFWQNLAEHPFLSGANAPFEDIQAV